MRRLYGSDKRKIETDLDFHFVYSGSLQGWGSFHSVSVAICNRAEEWECRSAVRTVADLRLKEALRICNVCNFSENDLRGL
jgi:hypothetical protein